MFHCAVVSQACSSIVSKNYLVANARWPSPEPSVSGTLFAGEGLALRLGAD